MYNSKFVNIEDAQILPSVQFEKGKTPAEVINRLRSFKSNNFTGDLVSQNRITTNGAIAGLLGGFLTALWFKQNKLLFSFTGMLGGALVGYTANGFINYRKTKIESGKEVKKI